MQKRAKSKKLYLFYFDILFFFNFEIKNFTQEHFIKKKKIQNGWQNRKTFSCFTMTFEMFFKSSDKKCSPKKCTQ